MTMLLTAYNGRILGPIAKLFGNIMNWIFNLGIHNVGVCIILFTLIIYILMLPLTIKQQKFSKMSALMNPEIKAIQDKYKGKKDEASMQAMRDETQEVYDKYGSSPTAGCLPLVIQMPILLALYRVIWNIPAYVPAIKSVYSNNGLIEMIKQINADSFMEFAASVNKISEVTDNTIIDVLWKLQSSGWESLKELGSSVAGFGDAATKTYAEISKYTNFLGLNIAESPISILKEAWAGKSFLMIIVALLIPVLAGVSQYLNMKLTSTATSGGDAQAQQLESMNKTMPLISVFFCFTFSTGIGIYWIAGAVIRSIQQVIINKSLSKMDMEKEIEKSRKRAMEKKKKSGVYATGVQEKAKRSTRSIATDSAANKPSPTASKGKAKAGSLAAKANMVQDFNERNKK